MSFRTRLIRRSTLAFCFALALGACTTWEPQSAPAPAGRELRAVRLTLDDGSAVVLERAEFRGDCIVGSPPGMRAPTAVALADVRKTEIRRSTRPAPSGRDSWAWARSSPPGSTW